jgi:hypothetical protein
VIRLGDRYSLPLIGKGSVLNRLYNQLFIINSISYFACYRAQISAFKELLQMAQTGNYVITIYS